MEKRNSVCKFRFVIQETTAPPGHVEIVHERINAVSTGGGVGGAPPRE